MRAAQPTKISFWNVCAVSMSGAVIGCLLLQEARASGRSWVQHQPPAAWGGAPQQEVLPGKSTGFTALWLGRATRLRHERPSANSWRVLDCGKLPR